VLVEVRATTQATKEIEARISDEVWDRQKRWELRREVLFEAAKRMTAVFDQLGQLQIVLQATKESKHAQDVFDAKKFEENQKWFRRLRVLRESRVFIDVTCGKDIVNATDKFVLLATSIAGQIHKNDFEVYKTSVDALFTSAIAIRAAIRKELALEGGVEGRA